ncbi:MAG: S-layer homology domain-containing protein [Ruminiclostridium sp.]|nr:S-layer homology domain-containing protein [Ruminiclostridium sp.]
MKRLIAWACTLCMLMGCMVLPASAATTNAEYVYSYFTNRGYSSQAAAAIVGNLMWESGSGGSFNIPLHTTESNGEGIGMVQWSFERKTNFMNFCSSKGVSWKNSTVGMQCEFLERELNGYYGNNWFISPYYSSSLSKYNMSLSTFKKTTDIALATGAFCFCFERPSETQSGISTRITYANKVYSAYGNGASVTLQAKTQNDGSILLSWNKTDWAGYWIYRSTSANGPWTTMSEQSSSATSWRDKNPSPGTTYYYLIQPFDSNRQGQNYSNYVTASPVATAVTLTATAQSDNSIVLSWNNTNWAGYWIYRSTSSNGPWTTMSEQPAGSTSWRDKNPTPGTTYHYFIQPFNSNRQGQNYSNYVTAKTTPQSSAITFNPNGGMLPSANASHPIDGINVGRGHEELIVYTHSGETTGTNKWGREYAFDSQGRLATVRGWGDDNQIKVPQDGFILSAQVDGSAGSDAGNFLIWTSTDGWYWGYDSQKAYAYDNLNAYLCHHKTVKSGSTYGTLPTISRDGYTFDGWYTTATGGTKVTSSTKVTNSSNHTLYAHWTKHQVTPTNAKVKTDKSTYEPGDTVTVTPSATGASDYSISVYCGDEKVFSDYTGFTGSISFPATKIGDYRVVVSCRNSSGYVDATCSFTVQKTEEVPPVMPPATSTEIHFPRVAAYTQGQFTDVPPSQWFTANVANAVEFGLMKGNSATTFNPYGDVTLAEAITMAARIHAIYTTGTESFDQSSGGKWYQVYMDYAYENGIIDNSYYTCDVTKKATRAQYAEIFANSLPGKGLEARNNVADNAIPDVPMSQTYADSVYKLYRAGILTGGDVLGTFSPKTYITRAECATIVARMADTDNRMSFTLT